MNHLFKMTRLLVITATVVSLGACNSLVNGLDGSDDASSGAITETDVTVAASELPAPAASFLANNHPGETITRVEENSSGYQVLLSDGSQLSFLSDGSFDGYDSDRQDDEKDDDITVSESDLPASIGSYLAENHPDASILRAERDDDGYDIYLSDGRELEFTLDGAFSGYDDDDDADSDQDRDDDDYEAEDDEDDDDVTVAPSDLPAAITDYIETNHSGATIATAERDEDGYDVYLDDGTSLDFSLDGTFKEYD